MTINRMAIAFMNNDKQVDSTSACIQANYRVLADVRVGPTSANPAGFPLPKITSVPDYSLDIDVSFKCFKLLEILAVNVSRTK
jgi:hypothetical protein